MIPIQLGDFSAKLWREDIFKLTIGNEILCQVSNDNGVRAVNFATSQNIVVKSTIFLHQTFISTPGPLLSGRVTII